MRRIVGSLPRSLAGLGLLALGLPAPASAQSVEEDSQRAQSVLDLERPGYEPRGLKWGKVIISPQLDVSATYNSNIYATRTGRIDDVVMRVRPQLLVAQDQGRVQWQALLDGELRRYASNDQENSETYGIAGTVSASLSQTLAVAGKAGYRRAVENRADPEVRQNPSLGPPLFDLASGALQIRLEGGKMGFSLKGEAEKYDFASSANADRDFRSLRATARIWRQVTPAINGFLQGYINRRDFDLPDPSTGASRDGRTLGGMAGIEFNPGGRIHGDMAAGVFRYRPDSSLFRSFSGFALEGSLAYSPRERTAFILDAFSGDVATVRSGASGRIDRSIRLTVQQEVRHNLIASAALRYRQTRYRGLDTRLNTMGAELEAEYLINRHFSVALTGQYVKRTSGNDADRFNRFQGGLTLRMRY